MCASPPDAHAIERSIRGTNTTSFDLVRVLWFYSRFCECGTRCFIYYSLPYHPSLFCFRSMPRSYAPSALRVLVTTKTWVMFISHVCIYPFVRGGKACWGWGASGKDVTKGPQEELCAVVRYRAWIGGLLIIARHLHCDRKVKRIYKKEKFVRAARYS